MSDYNSSLPIRTQNAGDAIVKIADATVPSQQLTVESDGSINVNAAFAPGTKVIITDGTDDIEVNADGSLNVVATATDLDIRDLAFASDSVDVSGSSVTVTATDLDIRDLAFATDSVDVSGSSVTVSATDLDIRDLTFASDKVDVSGSSVTVSATDLDIRDLDFATDSVDVSGSSVTVSATDLDIRDLDFATDSVDVSGSSVTVSATDLDIRDLNHASDSVKVGDGTDFLAVNSDGSINVKVSDRSGTEADSYNTAAAIASGGTSNHDYTTTGAFRLTSVHASGSGKMKIEVQIETASGSNTFNTKCVKFNSTSTPDMDWNLSSPILVASGARVRIIRTNRDNQAQDVYSTILGYNE